MQRVFLASAAALIFLAGAASAQPSRRTNTYSDIIVPPGQLVGVERDLFQANKQFPQISDNIARMNAECLATHQTAGMCQVYKDLVRQHHWTSHDQHPA